MTSQVDDDRHRLAKPELFIAIFVLGAATMVVEIMGTGVIGPVLGVGLFVRPALLSVTLGALALGYYCGGVLADRTRSPPTSGLWRRRPARYWRWFPRRARDLAIDQLFFEIVDRTHAFTSIYVYSAFGGGRGGLPISVTMRGPFNKFDTTAATRTDEFSGPARFTTGGVASLSVNFLNMTGLPRGIATCPNPL